MLGAVLLLPLAACAIDVGGLGVPSRDAAAEDAGAPPRDARPAAVDAGPRDAGVSVDGASAVDAGGGVDAAPPDAGPTDAGSPDAGPCPAGDADGDGVCDADDECPGFDDTDDEDGDGTPDDCDPCSLDGPSATPIALPASGSGITISRAEIDGGGNVAVVDPGQVVSLSIDYEITDCVCTGCIDQIEIGLVPGDGVSYCAYSAVPGCSGDSGSDTDTLTAPSAPGEYWIRFGQGQDYGCHDGWWHGTPPAGRTLGALCVR